MLATGLTVHNVLDTVEGWVALGTVGLAMATFWMARKTGALARTTADEIEVSRETLAEIRKQSATAEAQVGVEAASLEATFRPVIVSVPEGWAGYDVNGSEIVRYENGPVVELHGLNRQRVHAVGSQKHTHYSFPVRNVGTGTAFITHVESWWSGYGKEQGSASNKILPPGEATRVRFTLGTVPGETGHDKALEAGRFDAQVHYNDLGGHAWRSDITVVRSLSAPDTWIVLKVKVKKQGADDSLAVSSGEMY